MRRLAPLRPGRRSRSVRWPVGALLLAAVVYGAGLAALLTTRDDYVEHARLYLTVEDTLEWQGRRGTGFRVWTAGPGSIELWQAYRWIPAVREAREVWEDGLGVQPGERSP